MLFDGNFYNNRGDEIKVVICTKGDKAKRVEIGNERMVYSLPMTLWRLLRRRMIHSIIFSAIRRVCACCVGISCRSSSAVPVVMP